ncbi:MAG: copper-binding protein [Deltaproteobacteria bacterium]|jgi:Cu(I)/Ag(I) efflux system protein CusF|nr:copper-binding protein [Deltaproteobacteria bacterium]
MIKQLKNHKFKPSALEGRVNSTLFFPSKIARSLRLSSILILFFLACLFSPSLLLAQSSHSHSGHGDHGANSVQDSSAQANPSLSLPATFSVNGVLNDIDIPGERIVVAHEPIEAVGWGAMTMGFKVGDTELLEGLKVGDKVRLDIHFETLNDYWVVDLEPLE